MRGEGWAANCIHDTPPTRSFAPPVIPDIAYKIRATPQHGSPQQPMQPTTPPAFPARPRPARCAARHGPARHQDAQQAAHSAPETHYTAPHCRATHLLLDELLHGHGVVHLGELGGRLRVALLLGAVRVARRQRVLVLAGGVAVGALPEPAGMCHTVEAHALSDGMPAG